ncbi:MAG: multicopper oxidase family protein [Pseudomonadota bacterium]
MKLGSPWFALVLLGSAPLAVGCSAPPTPSSSQPADWDAELRLPNAVDENPDPNIFETTLTAKIANLELRPGVVTPVWTYNGLLPGPMIRVARGDRLIVHLKNELPEATTVHWHGIRLPNNMDGVPGSTQPAVEPGGSFDYDFIVPDAGTFWYHPHFDSAAEVGYGMYGPLIVTDPDEPAGLGDELVLVLSDMMLKPDGTQLEADAGGSFTTLFGREGDTLLVNGKVNPILQAKAGRRQRWRIINAAKSRYYQIELTGQQFTRFGGDDGLIAEPEQLAAIVLTPAQRADVAFDLAMPRSSSLPVRWVPYERGFGSKVYRAEENMFTIQTSADAPERSAPLPSLRRNIAAIDVSNATPQHFDLTQSAPGEPFSLGINGVPGDQAPPVVVTMGDTQLWTVKNTMAWAHPFHLHGFFFQVVDVNGEPPALREWRDTTDIPVDGVVRIAVKFDERPGMWMFHCHILDHADAGMMGMVMLHTGSAQSP